MKFPWAWIGSLLLAGTALAAPPLIEVEVRFVEFSESAAKSVAGEWKLNGTNGFTSIARQDTHLLAALQTSHGMDVLSAPRVRTRSGSNATVKVVREYRYPTEVEIRSFAETNGAEIVRGVAVVPSHFETIAEGVTLEVTPTYDARRDGIDLEVDAEVASDLAWKEYAIPYEGIDGIQRTAQFPQPIRTARHTATTLSLPNHGTIVLGGLIQQETKRIEDRVPVLGAIPWLGRLFRSSREVEEQQHLLVVVTAGTIDDGL